LTYTNHPNQNGFLLAGHFRLNGKNLMQLEKKDKSLHAFDF